nr:YibE/F family protein [Actinomyces bovis]
MKLGPTERRRVRIILAAIVVPLILATLLGLAVLWPGSRSLIGSQPFVGKDSSLATATITSLQVNDCKQSVAQLGAVVNEALLADAVCAQIDSGDFKGLNMPVHIPAESRGAAKVGAPLRVAYSPAALASGTPYVFIDYDRQTPVLALAIVYLLLVVAVAGRKGAASVLGLLLSSGVLVGFMIPALLAAHSPLAVTLVGSSAMMLLAVYVAHGISVRTTTALLGTLVGVAVTVLLALWGVEAANLTGANEESALVLNSLVKGLDLRALLTCGMVVAGLGVLNDVTITQASSVWELHAANPALGWGRLFAGGMRIGRDHIASTVYTLAFAYAGTALPLILAAAVIDRAVVDTMMSGEIAEEIVRTLVSSIGLVLAIPATTAIAAMLCRTTPVDYEDDEELWDENELAPAVGNNSAPRDV